MAANAFNSVLAQRPNRNRFNLSHDVKMSFKMGRLVPTAAIDLIPGDNIKVGVENMLRLAPLVSPVMHDIRVRTYWFFVPQRLLWEGWEPFITGSNDDPPPYVTTDTPDPQPIQEGSIADYFGFPLGSNSAVQFDPSPFAAYSLIYDEWFRDQNLQEPTFIPLDSGDNGDYQVYFFTPPFKRAWEHDYFTSALPFAQKGDPVTLPLVEDTNVPVGLSGINAPVFPRNVSDGTVNSGSFAVVTNSGEIRNNDTPADALFFDPNGTLSVNINENAVTINQLREAFRMQEFLELDALGGTRYTETIYAHFGVRSKDSRLQRPELVGSFSGRMVISEVLQTAQQTLGDDTNTGNTPLGTMAGHGISVSGGDGLDYYATEHGWLIGLINVQPKTAYMQGLPRKFSRSTREDWFWPKFAHIGEQPIRQKEIYFTSATPEAEFGYIPRYSEYRYEASRVSGEMRTSLAHWHMARIFDTEPALNSTFVGADPTDRIFAVLYDSAGDPLDQPDTIYAHIFNNVYASRLIPKYGKPML